MHCVFVYVTYKHILNYDHRREPKRTVFDSQCVFMMYGCMCCFDRKQRLKIPNQGYCQRYDTVFPF